MTATTSKPVSTWRPPPNGAWTYADYLQLPDNGFRYEIVEGNLRMSPAPSRRHQRAVVVLTYLIEAYLKERKLGQLFIAPFDVQLDKKTLVQPDLMVVLNDRLQIVTNQGVEGAPDLIIEALSPSTEGFDRRDKFKTYLKHRVREYWIVDVEEETVEVNVLRAEAYVPFPKFSRGHIVDSEVLPGLAVNTSEVFEG